MEWVRFTQGKLKDFYFIPANWQRYIIDALIYSVIFWIIWQFGDFFYITKAVSAIYPAPALNMAVFYFFGWRAIPAVYFAATMATVHYDLPWDQETYIWFNNLRQVIVHGSAAFCLHKLLQGGSFLSSSRNTLCFFAVVILFSALAALGGVTIFYWFDVIPQSVLFSVFFSFWAGDMTGLLMLAPIAFVVAGAWKEKQTGHLFRKSIRSMNWSRMFALLIPAVFSSAFFLYIIHRPDMAMYGYLIFIPLIWVAATHGAILASLAALISNLASAGVYSWMEASVYTTNQLHLVFAVGAAIALYLGVARDDRLRAESRAVEQESVLAEMSKMASLGELSNTIAHEIATPLQVASSNLQMSIRQLSRSKQVDTTQMLSYQHETQYALKKAIEIHHRVRQSAGKQSVSRNSRACLLKVVDEAKGLLNRNLTQSGTKVIVTSEKIASARIDETSMLQVFVNLFKNSITAMETESSKQKQIHCQITQQREKLIVNVFDTGPGFASGQAERVFDSFYTTKEDGLGLGLSICRTILEGVGGNIRIEQSQLGAHFVITLPIYEEVA